MFPRAWRRFSSSLVKSAESFPHCAAMPATQRNKAKLRQKKSALKWKPGFVASRKIRSRNTSARNDRARDTSFGHTIEVQTLMPTFRPTTVAHRTSIPRFLNSWRLASFRWFPLLWEATAFGLQLLKKRPESFIMTWKTAQLARLRHGLRQCNCTSSPPKCRSEYWPCPSTLGFQRSPTMQLPESEFKSLESSNNVKGMTYDIQIHFLGNPAGLDIGLRPGTHAIPKSFVCHQGPTGHLLLIYPQPVWLNANLYWFVTCSSPTQTKQHCSNLKLKLGFEALGKEIRPQCLSHSPAPSDWGWRWLHSHALDQAVKILQPFASGWSARRNCQLQPDRTPAKDCLGVSPAVTQPSALHVHKRVAEPRWQIELGATHEQWTVEKTSGGGRFWVPRCRRDNSSPPTPEFSEMTFSCLPCQAESSPRLNKS